MKPNNPGEFLTPEPKKKGMFEGWTAVDWFGGIISFIIFTAIATVLREYLNISRDWSWAIITIGIGIGYKTVNLIKKRKED